MSFSMKINLNCYYISQTQIMRKPFPCVLISIIAMLSFLGFGRSVGKQSYSHSQTQNHTKIVLDTFSLKLMSFSFKINHNCHYSSQAQIKRKTFLCVLISINAMLAFWLLLLCVVKITYLSIRSINSGSTVSRQALSSPGLRKRWEGFRLFLFDPGRFGFLQLSFSDNK